MTSETSHCLQPCLKHPLTPGIALGVQHAGMALEVNTQHFWSAAVPGLLKPEADVFRSVCTPVCKFIITSMGLDIFLHLEDFTDSQK